MTLRENNLKQIEGGRILDSQGVLVANRRALTEQPGLLAVVHELIERLEVHAGPFSVSVLAPHALHSLLSDCKGQAGWRARPALCAHALRNPPCIYVMPGAVLEGTCAHRLAWDVSTRGQDLFNV